MSMSQTLTLYGIPHCDRVKAARAWLAAQGVSAVFHDFKTRGVPPAHLPRWIDAVGWERLLNRQGSTWRRLDAACQASVCDAASAAALLMQQPSLIRRPVVEWPDGAITVGFAADDWQRRLGRA
ncbi:MAG: arsenate reductase [Ottowia sp.]|nr:MAG: arsenate reductase [Ottowia sp.]